MCAYRAYFPYKFEFINICTTYLQTKSSIRAVSSQQDKVYESVMSNVRGLEETQQAMSKELKEEMIENVKKQQSILNTLTKVAEKLDHIEKVQQPQIIYQPPPMNYTNPRRSYNCEFIDKKRRSRSHSDDRVNRRKSSSNSKKTINLAVEPFSKRLSESVERYYDRIKRDSLEKRNVERCVLIILFILNYFTFYHFLFISETVGI